MIIYFVNLLNMNKWQVTSQMVIEKLQSIEAFIEVTKKEFDELEDIF